MSETTDAKARPATRRSRSAMWGRQHAADQAGEQGAEAGTAPGPVPERASAGRARPCRSRPARRAAATASRRRHAMAADGDPGRDQVDDEGRRPRRCPGRQARAAEGEAEQQAGRDRQHDHRGEGEPRQAERDAAAHQVDRPVQQVRPRHQRHPRANHDPALRVVSCVKWSRDGADDARQHGGGERLQQGIAAQPAERPAQQSAEKAAGADQRQAERMHGTEDHAERHGAQPGHDAEPQGRGGRQAPISSSAAATWPSESRPSQHRSITSTRPRPVRCERRSAKRRRRSRTAGGRRQRQALQTATVIGRPRVLPSRSRSSSPCARRLAMPISRAPAAPTTPSASGVIA